jgi:hypothetical protein
MDQQREGWIAVNVCCCSILHAMGLLLHALQRLWLMPSVQLSK